MLRPLSSLQHLVVTATSKGRVTNSLLGEFTRSIGSLTALTSLTVAGGALLSGAMQNWSSLARLKILSLRKLECDSVSYEFSFLSQFTSLTELHLPDSFGNALSYLPGLPCLQRLSLNCMQPKHIIGLGEVRGITILEIDFQGTSTWLPVGDCRLQLPNRLVRLEAMLEPAFAAEQMWSIAQSSSLQQLVVHSGMHGDVRGVLEAIGRMRSISELTRCTASSGEAI